MSYNRSRGKFCTRCKRNTHYRNDCVARTFKDGNPIGRGGYQKKRY